MTSPERAVIERRGLLQVMAYIRAHEPICIQDVIRGIAPSNNRVIRDIILDLRDLGLVEVDDTPRESNRRMLSLSVRGRRALILMSRADSIARGLMA